MRIFKTVKDGQVATIALSEEAAWKSLESFWGYRPGEHLLWSVESAEQAVEEVPGLLRFWGEDGKSLPHVHWECPACGEPHQTDLEDDDPNPALWWCERAVDDAMFLVRWRQ